MMPMKILIPFFLLMSFQIMAQESSKLVFPSIKLYPEKNISKQKYSKKQSILYQNQFKKSKVEKINTEIDFAFFCRIENNLSRKLKIQINFGLPGFQ